MKTEGGVVNTVASLAVTTEGGAIATVTSPAAAEPTSVAALSQAPLMSVGIPAVPAAPAGAAAPFDARLIPDFDGTADVVEWLHRVEMLCQLRSVPVMSVLPLRLSGGAFAVWSQLPDASRGSLEAVRSALFAAFALDEHAAYEAFSVRRLRPGESADVFLADLRRLAALFGGMPERGLCCAFVAGLPEGVRQTLRAGSRADGLDLAGVLTRARALLSDERVTAAAARRDQPWPRRQAPEDRGDRRSGPGRRRCWTCGRPGHIAADCPQRQGNAAGEATPAPVSSLPPP